MKTTFKVQSTSYTVQAPHATYETRHLTDEQRLQLRVHDVIQQANKKHAKPRLKGSPRVYPKAGAVMSTADYVHRYFQQNANAYGSNKDKFDAEIVAFFQPLTTHISQPQGEDLHEVLP